MAAETRLTLTGDDPEPKPAEEQKSSSTSSRKKRGGDEPAGARTRRRHEGEIRGRLTAVIETLADTLEARGDHELATAIRDDGRAIVSGLVSITRPIAWARPVILAGLGIAEPVLAFGRIFRILAGRWSDRRHAKSEERQAAEYEAAIERRAQLVAFIEDPTTSEQDRQAARAELEALAAAGVH